MIDENQETEGDYLQLAQYIEDLEAGHAPQLLIALTPEQRRIYRMAAFFCSSSSHAVWPRPEFVEALRVHLLAVVKVSTETQIPLTHRVSVYRRTRPRRVHHHRRPPGS